MKTLKVITREVGTCRRAVPERFKPTRRAEWSPSVSTPAYAAWLVSLDVWGIVGCRLWVRGKEHAPPRFLCVCVGGGSYSFLSPWIHCSAHGRADEALMEWNGSRSVRSKPQTGLGVAASVCRSSTGNLNCRLLLRQPWSAHGEQNRMLLLKRRKTSCCQNKVWYRPNYSHCVTEEPSNTQICRQTLYRKVRTPVSKS